MRRSLALVLLAGCSDYGFFKGSDATPGGDPAIEVDPQLLDFWEVGAGEEEVLSYTVRNVGEAVLVVDRMDMLAAASFTQLDAEERVALDPGESRTFTVAFAPVEAGEQTGTITVHSDDPVAPEVPVDLVGSGLLPWLVVSPETHDFGEVAVPCPDDLTLTLQNQGEDDLIVSDLRYEGDGQLSLRETPELPFTLSPGAYTTVIVDLLPAAEGAITGALVVDSNDPRGTVSATQSATGALGESASDSFTLDEDPPVDILFAVDQSGSMDDDATALAANFSTFIDTLGAETDSWHLGVVTYDGGCFNEGVLESSTRSVDSLFESAVIEGDDRDIEDDEALFQLIDRALSQTDDGSCNEGFLQDGALLHLIVVTDEPERSAEEASAWTWDWFLERFEGYPDNPGLLKISGVVDADGCNEGADGYTQAIEATGGELLNICDDDWADDALALARASAELLYSFPLSQEPVEDTVTVRVDGAAVTEGWTWDPASNAVVFEEAPDGSGVVVDYRVASGCD